MKKTIIAAAVAAVFSASSYAQNLGFEDGTTTGWTSTTLSAVGSTTTQAGQNTWVISPYGNYMGQLQIQSGTFNQMTSALGLTSSSSTAITTLLQQQAQTGGGNPNPTTAGWVTKEVTLTAGQTFTLAWQYISVDYVPFNDGSIATLTQNGTNVATVNNYQQQYALLGFTNPGTGDYSTGSYGATGWQVATFQVSVDGTYTLGFGVFNLGDQALSPVLYIDEVQGTTTLNGQPFGAVAPNNSTAPSAPSTPTTPTTPTTVSTVNSGTTVDTSNLATNVTVNGGIIQMATSGVTLTNTFVADANGMTVDQNGNTVDFSGVISGTGGVTISNSGTGGGVTFSAVNTYTGTTTINSGASLTNTGTIAGTVTNLGSFTNSGTTGNVTNGFNGDGNTASLVNSGTVGNVTNWSSFANSGTTGNVTNFGTFTNTGDVATFNNAGVLNNNAGGTINELGYNNFWVVNNGTINTVTYNGGTVINSGTIGAINNTEAHGTFHNDGTVSGTVTTNSTFNNNATGVVQGLYTNNGTLNNSGTLADVTNNGTLNYNGGTVGNLVNNGTLDISANTQNSETVGDMTFYYSTVNSISGNGSVLLGDNYLSITNGNNNIYSGTISGTGGVAIENGTQTLSGNNTYTGVTLVGNQATLNNIGTLVGETWNFGTFNNNGTAGAVGNSGTVTNNGTVGAVLNGETGTFTNNGTTGDIVNSGTFNNNGYLPGTVVNLSTGTFTNDANGTFGVFGNYGTAINNGNLTDGTIANFEGGNITNNGSIAGTIGNNGTFVNNGALTGTVTNNAGGIFTNNSSGSFGTFNNYGTAVNNANLTSGTLNNYAGGTITNNGTIGMSFTNGGTLINNGTTGNWTNGGTITNTGTMGNGTNLADATFTNSSTVGTVDNQGTFNNSDTTGAVTNSGWFTNALNAVVGFFTNSGTAVNNGNTQAVSNSGTFTNNGNTLGVNNTGTFINAGTTGEVMNTGSFTNNGTVGVVYSNQGTFTNNGTTGEVLNEGTFNNAGTTGNWINELNSTITNSGTMANGTNHGGYTNSGNVGNIANTGTFTNTGNTGVVTNSGTFNYNGGTLGGYTQTSPGITVMFMDQPFVVTGAASLGGGLTINNSPTAYGKYPLLNAGSVTGTYDSFTSAGANDYLKYSGNDVKLYVTPPAGATQSSIDATAKNLSNAINLQSNPVTNALGNDCSVFGEAGACVSVNAGMSKAGTGDLYNGGLTVAKKVNDNWRVGVTTNLPFNNPTIGNVSQTSDPAYGLFATWTKDQLSVQGSAAFNQGTMTMTRQGPETGVGKMSVDNKAYQVKASYAIPVDETVTVTPYAGIRYIESNYGGFTEQGPVFPLTVNSTKRNQTSAIAGVSVAKQLTEKLSGNVSLGITQNLSGQSATFTGTSEIGGMSTFSSSLPTNGNTNPSVGAGLAYSIDKTTKVGVNVGWQARGDNANISSVGVSLTKGF